MAGPRDPEDTAAVRSGYHLWVLLLFLKARLPNHHSRVGDVWQELLKQLIKHTMFRWTVGETVESAVTRLALSPPEHVHARTAVSWAFLPLWP